MINVQEEGGIQELNTDDAVAKVGEGVIRRKKRRGVKK